MVPSDSWIRASYCCSNDEGVEIVVPASESCIGGSPKEVWGRDLVQNVKVLGRDRMDRLRVELWRRSAWSGWVHVHMSAMVSRPLRIKRG